MTNLEGDTSGRRNALHHMVLWMFGGIWTRIPHLPSIEAARMSQGTTPATETTQDDEAARLLSELDRLSARNYSQEGIPVFLVCEDLVSRRDPSRPEPRTQTAELASTFRKWANVLLRARPEATPADIPKLIEVLADWDVTDTGKK